MLSADSHSTKSEAVGTPDMSTQQPSTVEAPVAKVPLFLRAVGDAPPIQKSKFQLSGNKPVSYIQGFLRKTLQTDKGIYLFCCSSFSPNPGQTVQELFDAFQVSGELTICYSFQETWG